MCVGKPGFGTQDFVVHQYLICDNSPFFENAVAKAGRGNDSCTIELPEVSVDTFMFYFNWLYDVKTLTISNPQIDSLSATRKAMFNTICNRLLRAYLLGTRLQDWDFCDMITDNVLELMAKFRRVCLKVGHAIFAASLEDSPPRLLLIDMRAHAAHPGWWAMDPAEVQGDYMSHEAWVQVVKGLVEAKYEWTRRYNKKYYQEPARLYEKNTCRYHWHTHHGTPCYKDKRFVRRRS
jgi:hypothetical protein